MAPGFGNPISASRAIDLVAYGSRGDVQPMVELGRALAAAGHRPRLLCPPDELGLASAAGISAIPIGASVRAHFASPSSMRDPRRLLRFVDFLAAQIGPMTSSLVRELDADLVLATGVAWGAPIAAERRALRYRFVALSPAVLPSGAHGPPILPQFRWPPTFQRTLWRAAERVLEARLGAAFQAARRAVGLPRFRRVHQALLGPEVLVASDAALGPLPSDLAMAARQLGFRAPRSVPPLPGPVEAFLADGPPPLYVGLGSMSHHDPVGLAKTFVAAAHEAHLRIIIQRGWARLDPGETAHRTTDARTLVVDELSHAALFPRVSAVLHHGGAGTTATAARAGVPQIIWPQFLDQYYWARQIPALGVGVALPWRLGPIALRSALGAVADPMMRLRARALATTLATADASDHAIATIVELAA